jgi:hypothetical protein
LAFIKKALKRHGSPKAITTDGLRSYKAAMKEVGNAEKQEVGRWANNRVENSHQPFRRRERAMLRFRQMKSLQKFASVHASFHNHFNKDRHLTKRDSFKDQRSAALAEWKSSWTKPRRGRGTCARPEMVWTALTAASACHDDGRRNTSSKEHRPWIRLAPWGSI